MCIGPTLDSNAFRAFGTSAQLPVDYCNFTATQWQPSVQHMEDGDLEQPKIKDTQWLAAWRVLSVLR